MNEKNTSQIYLIAGLGNPGRRFRTDRHNIGFMVMDKLAEKYGSAFGRAQFDALITNFRNDEGKVFLVKPQTFMNNSGTSVAPLKRYYRVLNTNMLIIFDDLDLPVGYLRVRPQGGSGGHQGMKSIINRIGTTKFPRMRLGIGRPPGRMDPSKYVLQSFTEEESPTVEIQVNRAVDCVEAFLTDGIEAAMNRFNE
jgi:PTH1 family peptidyl-tRNA hydrolase